MPDCPSVVSRDHIPQFQSRMLITKSNASNIHSSASSSSSSSPVTTSTDTNFLSPNIGDNISRMAQQHPQSQQHRPPPIAAAGATGSSNGGSAAAAAAAATATTTTTTTTTAAASSAAPAPVASSSFSSNNPFSQPASPHQAFSLNNSSSTGRKASFGLHFLSNFSMRSQSDTATPVLAQPPPPPQQQHQQQQLLQQPVHLQDQTAQQDFSFLPPQHRYIQSMQQPLMSNSPTIGNINSYAEDNINDTTSTPFYETHESLQQGEPDQTLDTVPANSQHQEPLSTQSASILQEDNMIDFESNSEYVSLLHPPQEATAAATATATATAAAAATTTTITTTASSSAEAEKMNNGRDKDGFFSVRLTPLIDHSSSSSGLYFSPVIRKVKPKGSLSIGRYTEKNKAAAHAAQGSSAPIVFKSKVVSRTHALLDCNEEGQWFLKDCKSSSGTFLNHIRLSPASQESTLMPVIDGDIIQLGMDYRGGTEEVYRCVKMRCEFNKSWQRKVNQFNLEIHKKFKNLNLQGDESTDTSNVNMKGSGGNGSMDASNSECAICLMQVEPCQALFISPCSHSWHYKCIRPIIIKSYPQFYCPNCRTMCDLETDIEDD
ncbi:hypothetical protein KGF56_000064 [Candida oxycetoniae]|uniref:RING-type E3 ubiquitin transferase n=1 Tax=Candida oxycetoniae TaxID=497107 RepID=A0AAI9T1T4_9ASCO|nr:uncharacterized protein KGF56_000064 [Candida oxycetoniae]KAI3407077.2 hypothetical protein KGF56_000064 [Candida oxycetoniae]